MSVRTLEDPVEWSACMYDSVTMTAFGPIFDERHCVGTEVPSEAIDSFLAWLKEDGPRVAQMRPAGWDGRNVGDGSDPREWADWALGNFVNEWRQQRKGAAA